MGLRQEFALCGEPVHLRAPCAHTPKENYCKFTYWHVLSLRKMHTETERTWKTPHRDQKSTENSTQTVPWTEYQTQDSETHRTATILLLNARFFLMYVSSECYAGIRLHNIFVFHNDHHIRLVNHNAINSCCILATLGNLNLTNDRSCSCTGEEDQKNCQKNVKEYIIGGEKIPKNSDMLDFLLGCRGASHMPRSCSLMITLQGLFIVPNIHIWPDAG